MKEKTERKRVELPSESQWSLKGGAWFVYQNNNVIVRVHGSVGGKEDVFLNDDLVSSKRSLQLLSEHDFIDAENNKYEVKFITTNLRRGEMTCTLVMNGNVLKTFKTKYQWPKIGQVLKRILLSFVIGIVVGTTMILLKLPEIASKGAIVLVILAVLLTKSKKGRGQLIISEE
jgi:hypothetical protein